MHHAAKAYGAVAKQTASPRQLEADLLLRAAAQLQSIHDNWDAAQAQLDGALLYNRKLWTIFLSDVTEGENALPQDMRQNIANLGIFVLKQTLAAMSDPNPAKLNSLININRQLAGGLIAS